MTYNYKEYKQNLTERYRKSGRAGLLEREMLELLLMQQNTEIDVRSKVKTLMESGGSLHNVMNTSLDELDALVGSDIALTISIIKEIMTIYFEPKVGDRIITLSSPESVGEYIKDNIIPYSENGLYRFCIAELGSQDREFFLVLFLNAANRLIEKKIMFAGTIDQAQVYPREIIKVALQINASALILVHNHPSGNNKPSEDDIVLTKRLESIGKEFGLRIHDHIVVTTGTAYSIRANRLIDF